ncbi:MAG: hypothetical protein Q4C34_08745 [Bacteroidales bacterium]|nr:hypothetical protein [Bacteroidales bacterium]
MTLFWIGIAVFATGFVARLVFKYLFYREYREGLPNELRHREVSAKYRPRIYISRAFQYVGLLICLIGWW